MPDNYGPDNSCLSFNGRAFFELDINIKNLVEKNKNNVTLLVVTFIFFVHKTKKRLSFQVVDKEG